MHYFLRPATNDDRAAIERLLFTALAEHGLKPDPSDTDADLHDIQASYFAGGGTFDLLVDGSGQVVGSVERPIWASAASRWRPPPCEVNAGVERLLFLAGPVPPRKD